MKLSVFSLLIVTVCVSVSAGTERLGNFLKVDCDTGLFTDGNKCFPLICVTYVQPDPGSPGANSGRPQLFLMDLRKIRTDFKMMRSVGINCIYMRIGAGLFFNEDGQWRKLSDPVSGIPDSMFVRFSLEQIAEERKLAAKMGIGPFEYTYELFDYMLDCAEMEGIYVVPTLLDNWSIPRKYERAVLNKGVFHKKTWESLIKDWTKILARYKDRKIIAGYLIDGELMHKFQTWTDKEWFFLGPKGQRQEVEESPLEFYDEEVTSKFQDFLKQRYKTIEKLKTTWQYGYDRENPDYKHNIPLYEFKTGVFDYSSFKDIQLPVTERAKGEDKAGRGKNFPYWSNVPMDPVWIDFNYFRQWIFINRVNEFIEQMKKVDSNHIFMYSAAADYVPSWHPFVVCRNHGRLDCEVLLHGGGYTSSVNLSATEPYSYETVMELYKSVGLYRPTSGGGLNSCIFGMGEGGYSFESNNPTALEENLPETLQDRWVSQLLMDNFGSGAGFINIWDWGTIWGATVERPELHYQEVADSIKSISKGLEKDKFSNNRNAKVLILANGPTLNAIMNSVSMNNIIALSSCLAMTHLGFDIVSTDDISFGKSDDKVDINKYDAIFMPQLFQVPVEQTGPFATIEDGYNIWQMLKSWLETRRNRLLCIGVNGMKDVYFKPLEELPEEYTYVSGDVEFGELYKIPPGKAQPCRLRTAAGDTFDFHLENLLIQELYPGHRERAAPFLYSEDKVMGTKRTLDNGSVVYQFGFPLGLSWMHLYDMKLAGKNINEKDTEQLARFYQTLLLESGIKADYEAPKSIVAYISDNAETIFVRQRFSEGMKNGKLLSSSSIAGHIYAGVKTITKRKDGKLTVEIIGDLGENLSAVLMSVGTVEMVKDGTVEITVTPIKTGSKIKYDIEVVGAELCRINLDALDEN